MEVPMMSDLLFRLRTLFRRKWMQAALDEEVQSHLRMAAQERIEQGESHEQAQTAALREFGNVGLVKEVTRDVWGWRWLETFLQDIRYSLRQLRRSPGFVAVAVATLGLGIGATTVVFSVVDAVLLHGTPYRNPSQLAEISAKNPHGEEMWVSGGDFNDWQSLPQAFESLAAFKRWEFRVLTGPGEPDDVWTEPMSGSAFHLLGVNAVLGRTFAENETQAVVLSPAYWRSHFAANPKIIGKTLTLDAKPYTVIGVAPADFEFPDPHTQIWVPLTFTAAEKADHEHHTVRVIARLSAGSTLKQAQAALDVVTRRLALEYPKTNAGWSAIVKPFEARKIGSNSRLAILALLAAVTFVLLTVCANLTSMLLARGTTRQREIVIRAALGAGRWRLIRQLVVEGTLLAVGGIVAGLVLAWWGLATVLKLLPKYTLIEPGVYRTSLNLPVLAFAVALALLTGVVVSLLPALRLSNPNLNESLKQQGRTPGTGARGSRLQRVLIVSEVALALVLLVGAGLMIQTFERLETAPTGFKPDHLLTVRVPLVGYKYSTREQSPAFYHTVMGRILAVPGVRAAGMANNLPFIGFNTSVDFPAPPNWSGEHTFFLRARSVSPGYFQAMGIPFKGGRDFTEADNRKDARCVRIVNEAMARLYWPGQDPVGQQINKDCRNDTPSLIVGLVADSKMGSVGSKAEPELYIPYAQAPFGSFLVTFVIRTSSNPTDVAAAVRRAVWEVDHDQPVIQVRTMENVISESLWWERVSGLTLGIFAAISLLLAVVGIYGVFSYSVTQRTHEIGIRTALGATRGDILRMVVREGALLTLAGVGAGILAALALTRLLASLLYGIRPRDPLTFIALSLLLATVALAACYIPARRATKVDPMVALRYE
jgi:putative ABC transport system permease protein